MSEGRVNTEMQGKTKELVILWEIMGKARIRLVGVDPQLYH